MAHKDQLVTQIAQNFFGDSPAPDDLELVRAALGITDIDAFTPIGASQDEMIDAGYMLATDSQVDPRRCIRLITQTPFVLAHSEVDCDKIMNTITSANELLVHDHGYFPRLLHSFHPRLVPEGAQSIQEVINGIDSQEKLLALWKAIESILGYKKSAFASREIFLAKLGAQVDKIEVTDGVAGLTFSHRGFNLALLACLDKRDLGNDFFQVAQTMALHFAVLETLFAGCKTASSVLTRVPESDGILDPRVLQLLNRQTIALAVETSYFREDVSSMIFEGQKVTPLWDFNIALVHLSE